MTPEETNDMIEKRIDELLAQKLPISLMTPEETNDMIKDRVDELLAEKAPTLKRQWNIIDEIDEYQAKGIDPVAELNGLVKPIPTFNEWVEWKHTADRLALQDRIMSKIKSGYWYPNGPHLEPLKYSSAKLSDNILAYVDEPFGRIKFRNMTEEEAEEKMENKPTSLPQTVYYYWDYDEQNYIVVLDRTGDPIICRAEHLDDARDDLEMEMCNEIYKTKGLTQDWNPVVTSMLWDIDRVKAVVNRARDKETLAHKADLEKRESDLIRAINRLPLVDPNSLYPVTMSLAKTLLEEYLQITRDELYGTSDIRKCE